jgi:hypothetical protein
MLLFESIEDSDVPSSSSRIMGSAHRPILTKEMKFVLLMDYIDEILQFIFETSESAEQTKQKGQPTVCMMEVTLTYCWNYGYLLVD